MAQRNNPLFNVIVCKLSLADIKIMKLRVVKMLSLYSRMKLYTYKYTHNQRKGVAVI